MAAGGGPGRGGPAGNNHNPSGIGGVQQGDPGRNTTGAGYFKKQPVRGRTAWSMTRTLRRVLREKGPSGARNDLEIARTLIAMAQDRDPQAIQYIFDRIDGKLATKQEVSQQISGGTSPLTIAVDSYLEERVIHDDETRRLAHAMLAQLVGGTIALPSPGENGHEDV